MGENSGGFNNIIKYIISALRSSIQNRKSFAVIPVQKWDSKAVTMNCTFWKTRELKSKVEMEDKKLLGLQYLGAWNLALELHSWMCRLFRLIWFIKTTLFLEN